MEFYCNPIALMENDEVKINLKMIYNSFLEQGIIPICLIEDKDNELFKMYSYPPSPGFKLQYILITIKHFNTFEA